MALNTVTTGNTVLASDINQLVNQLQTPSGGTSTGSYYLDSWSNAANLEVGTWVNPLSRVSVPVSVSIDTSISSPVSANAPSTNLLSATGFHVYTTSSGSAIKFYCGGNYTIQY